MILIFRDKAAYEAVRDDIVVTPAIGSSTPIALHDEPAVAPDGRCLIEYAWDEATCDWLRAYTAGDNPAVTFAEAVPEDWYLNPAASGSGQS